MDGKGFDELTRKVAQGMSRRTMLRGLIGGGAAVVATKAGGSLAAPREKQVICHAEGNGSFHLINVSVNAIPAHEAHGDGYLGTTAHCSDCGDACSGGQDCCSGSCTNLGTNENCASCGDVCDAFSNSYCDGGTCTACGGFSQTCCAGNTCGFGLICQNGRCNNRCTWGTCPNGTCCGPGLCGFCRQ